MKALYTAALCGSLLLGPLAYAQTTSTTPQTPNSTTSAPGTSATPGTTPAPGTSTTPNTSTTPGTSSTPGMSTTPAVSPTVLCGLAQESGAQGAGRSTTPGGTAGTAGTPSSPAGNSGGTTGSAAATPGSSAGSSGSTSGTATTGTATTGTATTGTATTGTAGSGTAPSTSGGTSGGTAGTGTSTGTAGTSGTPGSTTSPGATSTPAPGAPAGSNATGARLTSTDTCFAEQAALSDQFEIQSSQLASAQAANARVKTLASQLIQDHTAATRQLSALAPQLGLRLPTALSGPKLTELAALRTSKGAAFDRAYVNAQVTAHEQAVNLFRAYSKSGGNAQLRAHATRTLPALERHLQAARDLLTALTR